MSARTREIDLATGLAAVLVLGAVALAVIYGWRTPPGVVPTFRWEGVQLAIETVCFSMAAVALVTRRAGRVIAWVLLLRGVGVLVFLAMLALMAWHGGTVELGLLALGLSASNWVSITLAVWLPDGRLPGRGWRWYVGGVAAFALVDVFLSSSTASTVYGVPNPVVGWLPLAAGYPYVTPYVVIAFVLVSGLSVAFRRMNPVQRRQAGLLIPMYVLWEGECVLWTFNVLPAGPRFALAYVMTVLWPVVLVTVIARDRVSRLDLAARRATVVAVLAVPIGAAVAFLPPEATVVAVLATLAGTLLVPLSRWVGAGVDRLIYGRRATPYAAARSLTGRLRDSLAPAEVPAVICDLVVDTLRFPFASMHAGDRLLAQAGTPAGVEPLVFELRHQGRLVGRLLVEPRQEWGGVDDADLGILQSLADQAALAVQLSERAAELAASRARIVQAQDTARRRIERSLHDGIQQELVALVARLRLVRNQARRGMGIDTELTGIQDDAYRIIDGLRELAHGIHPPVLTDRGLLAAVESTARRLPIPIAIDAPELGRFPTDIEESAFFLVSEALTNVLKHADARQVTIRLAGGGDRLEIEVGDDGVGCADGYRGGSGLTEMRDRVDTVGGHLVIEPRPGGGTMVRAVLPHRRRETTNA
ncbi:GAF domain-containing sensor histidine kinase [Kutzneria buriramensis]|uniref:histidine kinase n=1 Tax=Kutzneria buriramensis TaxID=1045776 RepID=A0A3E0H4Y7_9PSEU|nr:GAF domain-containing sensor histidine kinase [Kutzneria buriramensis]REH37237.1 histidine kinase/DNA gyrase B/HSP90-like ATPase [Kutzneria buriramensis]